VHWESAFPNQNTVKAHESEINCKLSSNTALIENLEAVGAVSLLVMNIENATMTQSQIVPLICKALRNIDIFEVSSSRNERWIQDGDGLSAFEKIKFDGMVEFVVSDETHAHLKQAREFCDMAIEALCEIPSYRKTMEERRLIPRTSETSMFSRAFSVLGL